MADALSCVSSSFFMDNVRLVAAHDWGGGWGGVLAVVFGFVRPLAVKTFRRAFVYHFQNLFDYHCDNLSCEAAILFATVFSCFG